MNKIRKLLQNGIGLFSLLVLLVASFIFFDFFNLDEKVYFLLTGKHNYDILFWGNINIGTVATLSAVFVALYSSQKSIKLVNKQLRIEQQPLVVVENSIVIDPDRKNDYLQIKFKNIGRGAAVRITACLSRTDRNKAFFHYNESHTFELGANAKSVSRRIDKGILDERMKVSDGTIQLFSKKNPLYIHIYYEDQLGNMYHRKAKFFTQPEILKLIENKNY